MPETKLTTAQQLTLKALGNLMMELRKEADVIEREIHRIKGEATVR